MVPRIGYGYDVHRLAEGYDFWLGGVKLDYHLGAVGHSDADVLLHAICDALLGAAALRDIGYHFPDTDQRYKGISSLLLLHRVGQLIKEQGYLISNIDSTVVLQKPKIAAFIPEMQENIAKALNIGVNQVSVKATTSEGLGFEGRHEGISAFAVVLIYSL
ncbi:MAG: 2-C-methyl-D-erythritol 2,4-cyclodiphosphate synthase [Bacteroidales bacterium]|jgi:2-C-methyl-D-erythritol 2,4-cyclodiphosphate synthase|nr:2-C-methyl-D-erythritol 2,4-cyclodiphosphate synthase [Bacteroidales bacterium]